MKRMLSLVLVGALSGGALWAADAWESDKNYTEWSGKEIRKVLRKSPWAKTVTLTLFSDPGVQNQAPEKKGLWDPWESAGVSWSKVEIGEGGHLYYCDTGGTGETGHEYGAIGHGGVAALVVRWQTALPIRQAFALQQIQAEEITPERAEQLIQRTPSEYVVAVTGMPVGDLAGSSEDKVKASTYLKTGDGQRIKVQDVRMSQGRVRSFFFVFPRAIPIELRHESVEFVTRFGQYPIKKKFSLKKMLFEGKLEL